MDQRDSCIPSPALNELSKRLNNETDRLQYARVIYLSESIRHRLKSIRREMQAPCEYDKRQRREQAPDRNRCAHQSLMVTNAMTTNKQQHVYPRRSTSYMPQLIQTIDAFEHNRCRCSIPPCCIEKRSMNLAEKLSAPPEIDSADESLVSPSDTSESSFCSDEFAKEIQQRFSSYANVTHTASFKYDLDKCSNKQEKEYFEEEEIDESREANMRNEQDEDAVTLNAVSDTIATPNQKPEYSDFYAMVEPLSNIEDPSSLASTLLSSCTTKILQDHKADDNATLHEVQGCYLDIAENTYLVTNNNMPPTPPLSPAGTRDVCESLKLPSARKPSLSIERVNKKSRSGLRGLFKRAQYQVNDILISGRSPAAPAVDYLYSAKDLTANEPRIVLKLVFTEVGSYTPNIMQPYGFDFEILRPGVKPKRSPRMASTVSDARLGNAIQDWIDLVFKNYPQAPCFTKARRILRDNKKLYVVYDTL